MTDISILESIQEFLQDNVASQVKFKKPNDKNVLDYQLVNPAVHVGYIPPNGMIPKEIQAAMPCIIVGHDDGEDDGVDSGLNIRLTFVVWNPGFLDENGNLTPNFEGYRDLLNFIDKAKHELRIKRIFEKAAVDYPLKWGMYQDPPYPYWYGWITFKAKVRAENYIETYKEYL